MILFDFNQIVITRIYAFQTQRKKDVSELYQDEFFIKALNRDIFDFVRRVHNEYGHIYGDVILCADGNGISWRREIFPHYKALRRKNTSDDQTKKMKKFVSDYINYFVEEFETGPATIYKIDGVEADDIIGLLILDNPNERHMIVSRDKDFHQLHSDMVVSYDYSNDLIVRNTNKNVLLEHIIRGDSGDGIPNIMSDLDTFVTDGKRQKSMTKKRMESFLKEIPEELSERFQENKMLISLRDIPEHVKEKIRNAATN